MVDRLNTVFLTPDEVLHHLPTLAQIPKKICYNMVEMTVTIE